jgi:hypothetical protein|nr:MAG TPA: hypothetical protein [Inoviridae sp.]
MNIVAQIIQILVSGLQEMATGIGGGLNNLAQSIFLKQNESTWVLSQFGELIIAFGAVALAVGLSRFVVNWLTSFGR